MTDSILKNRGSALFLLFILSLLFAISCEMDNASLRNKDKREGIHETIEQGTVLISLETDRKEISIAERLSLTISVTADEDDEIELPGFDGRLDRFSIVDYQTIGPILVYNNRIRISRSYVLEPFLPGDYTIPPMLIIYRGKNKTEAEAREVKTPDVIVRVNSLLPENIKEAKLNDIEPPVPFPRVSNLWLWAGGCAIAVLITALLISFAKREKPKESSPEKILSAHELAYLELDKLRKEDLITRGEIKLFFQKISWILRCYIENRFGIHAPEQTTQEFLTGLGFEYNLPGIYKPLLKTFLKQCDLVKFAEHQPRYNDIQKAFYDCKAFIDGTRIKEPDVYAL